MTIKYKKFNFTKRIYKMFKTNINQAIFETNLTQVVDSLRKFSDY